MAKNKDFKKKGEEISGKWWKCSRCGGHHYSLYVCRVPIKTKNKPKVFCGGDHCSELWNLDCSDPKHPWAKTFTNKQLLKEVKKASKLNIMKPLGDKRGWEKLDIIMSMLGLDGEQMDEIRDYVRSLVAKTKKDMVEEIKKSLPTHKGKMLSRTELKKELDKLRFGLS